MGEVGAKLAGSIGKDGHDIVMVAIFAYPYSKWSDPLGFFWTSCGRLLVGLLSYSPCAVGGRGDGG